METDNRKQINIRRGALPEYVIKLFSKGCCPGLMPLAIAGSQEEYICFASLTGYIKFTDYVKAGEREGVLGCFYRLVCALRRICEAASSAEEYLAAASMLDFSPENIYIGISGVRLLPAWERNSGTFCEMLINLCLKTEELLPGCGAERAALKLKDLCSEAIPSKAQIHRMLSLWESELRG